MKNKLFILVFACLTFLIFPAVAQETIESFDSLIKVQTDGSMIVTETLRVHHEGINIRRGIYRDLPTKKGEKYELIGVTRNGNYEPSFVEKGFDYYRINTGDDSFLPQPDTSTFQITYKVWNIPKAYKGYDEVYWNVTGDEWAFPIEQVSAKIELPEGIDIIQKASYIGYKGSQEPATYDGQGGFHGRSLSPGEQLTVAVGFTPGIINTKKYTPQEETFQKIAPIILYGIYLVFLILAWHKKGRDPRGRAIMPQYEPPEELTAAQAACLYKKGKTDNLVPISLIQMVSNGFLKLTATTEKILFIKQTNYLLEKTGKEPDNVEEECVKKNKIKLDGQYHGSVKNLAECIKAKIKKDMKTYYTQNNMWVLLPTIIVFAVLITLCAKKGINLTSESFIIFFGSCIPAIIVMMLIFSSIVSLCKNKTLKNLIPNIILILFCVQFIKSWGLTWDVVQPYVYEFKYEIVFLIITLATFSFFSHLMYCPTEKGQRLTEHLEGLKMFLKATQLPTKEKLKIEQKLNQEKMEKLFPYAMALGLEKEWEDKFSELFGKSAYQNFTAQHPYATYMFCTSFASNVSQCSVSHSSGGSGSGSGGGGCSGGGGGGGGGGGR